MPDAINWPDFQPQIDLAMKSAVNGKLVFQQNRPRTAVRLFEMPAQKPPLVLTEPLWLRRVREHCQRSGGADMAEGLLGGILGDENQEPGDAAAIGAFT